MPKFEKGSIEAREYMAKLRAARKPKLAGETKGNGVGGKIGDSIKKTFKKASKTVANVATDAYHMSPAEAVKGVKNISIDAFDKAKSVSGDAIDKIKSVGGAIPPPPSRLPSSMFNPVGAGFKDGWKDSDDSSSDSDDARGGKLHDCPMCHGMGIVKKKRMR